MSRLIAISLMALLGVAAPAAAQDATAKPEDVLRVEQAVTGLATAKRAAANEVAERQKAAVKALGACKSGGKGWKRIRAVKVPVQRSLYTRGARELWKGLGEVAAERGALEAYRPGFERFLSRFDRPLADPVLQAGVDAWRGRIAYYEAATNFATCKTFATLLKPVRQFKENVRADYLAGDIYNKMVRFVADSRRKAAARHWPSRHDAALEAARTQLVALGGNEGYATFFAFGHSLRG